MKPAHGGLPEGIEAMALYRRVDRVFVELKALGYGPGDPVDVETLSGLDQYHYLGTDAVDEARRRLGISTGSRVLEIGSGIGGPARHLAHVAGCRVTALELQQELHDTARALTGRCGLDARVEHVRGDVLDGVPDAGSFDAVVSWLTFLHIPQRPALYRRCFEALRPGGGMYVEDYFARGSLGDRERRELAREVFCHHVPFLGEVRDDLEAAGFHAVELIEVTEDWSRFVAERRRSFAADRERHVGLHGAGLVDDLGRFYDTVARLFDGGNLGGLRLVARKPAG